MTRMVDTFFNSSTECPATTNITSAKGLQGILFSEAVLAFFGLLPNALMVVVAIRARVFHMNLRLLLAHLNAVLFAYAAAFIPKAATTLATINFGNVCTLAINLYDCKVKEMPVAFPNNAITYASVAICLERVYCTIRYKIYESNTAKPWLAAALILVVWTVVITNQLVNLAGIPRAKSSPICENMLAVTPPSAVASLAPQVTLEASMILIILVVHLYNRHQLDTVFVNRSKMTLSARFQMEQNVQVNQIVTPCVLFQAACVIPVMIFLILVDIGYEMPLITKVILLHISYLWKLIFVCVQPLFTFYANPHLKKGLKKLYEEMATAMLSAKGQVSPTTIERGPAPLSRAATGMDDAEVYFRNLEKQWAVVITGRKHEQNRILNYAK